MARYALHADALDAAAEVLLERDHRRHLVTSRHLNRRELTDATIAEYRAAAREVIERYIAEAEGAPARTALIGSDDSGDSPALSVAPTLPRATSETVGAQGNPPAAHA